LDFVKSEQDLNYIFEKLTLSLRKSSWIK